MTNKIALCFVLTLAFAQTATATDVRLDANRYLVAQNGYFWSLHFEDALKACPVGTHLPTAREIALDGQSRGAKGLLEITIANRDFVPEGYVKISTIELDGQRDEFYYSAEGYQDNLPNALFWSSSVAQGPRQNKAYGMFGENGEIAAVRHEGIRTLVRCFQNL